MRGVLFYVVWGASSRSAAVEAGVGEGEGGGLAAAEGLGGFGDG